MSWEWVRNRMMIFAGCERFGCWFMKLFLFFGSLIVRMFFGVGILFLYKVSITIFTKQSLSVLFSIFYRLGIIEKDGKEFKAVELSQPDKNHQKEGGFMI